MHSCTLKRKVRLSTKRARPPGRPGVPLRPSKRARAEVTPRPPGDAHDFPIPSVPSMVCQTCYKQPGFSTDRRVNRLHGTTGSSGGEALAAAGLRLPRVGPGPRAVPPLHPPPPIRDPLNTLNTKCTKGEGPCRLITLIGGGKGGSHGR